MGRCCFCLSHGRPLVESLSFSGFVYLALDGVYVVKLTAVTNKFSCRRRLHSHNAFSGRTRRLLSRAGNQLSGLVASLRRPGRKHYWHKFLERRVGIEAGGTCLQSGADGVDAHKSREFSL
jgi:hypothetical protein